MVPNATDIGLRWISDLLAHEKELEDILQVPIGLTLGCGAFGCVMQSSGPWVVKITSDPTEGNVWQTIKNIADEEDYTMRGFPRVMRVVRIKPDITTEFGSRPLHVIVREGADPVFKEQGVSSKRTLSEMGLSRQVIERGYDPLQRWFPYSPPPDTLMDELADEHVAARDRPEVFENIVAMLEALRAIKVYRFLGREVMHERDRIGDLWFVNPTTELVQRRGPEILETMLEWTKSKPLAKSLLYFAETGQVFSDVHFMNLGWRIRQKIVGFSDTPLCLVVLDPGATFLDREVEIETFTLRRRRR